MLLTCWLNVSFLSMTTPRLLTLSDVFLDVNSSGVDCVDVAFYPLSFASANYNCFSLLEIQAQFIEV